MYLNTGNALETIAKLHRFLNSFEDSVKTATYDLSYAEKLRDQAYDAYNDFERVDGMTEEMFNDKSKILRSEYEKYSELACYKEKVLSSLIYGIKDELKSL